MMRFTEPFDEFDRIVGQLGGRWRAGMMPMDAYEQDGTYVLRFDLPGVGPEQVDVTVENGQITVTAERSFEDTEGVTWLVRERPTGTHQRQIRLGRQLDGGAVTASYDDGVLTVTVPMREEAKPRKVSVASTSQSAIPAEVH
jgi:HSP20 family protein